MEELRDLLMNMNGSYEDFVDFTLSIARRSSSNQSKLLSFIYSRPELSPSDVLEYLTDDLGLYEEYRKQQAAGALANA